jgi:agmatinase
MATVSKKTTFYGATAARTARGAGAAIFAAPHGTPYRGIDNRMHAKAGDSFRAAMKADAAWISHWDFDFGGPILPDADFKFVDLGNLPTRNADGRGNRTKIETQTKAILNAGAVPIMFGGDDSVPIPFIQAYAGGPPIIVLQIDAHIDWRDEREKEKFGFSSTMRRASEQEHVWRIVQAGAHGLGSAREAEVEAAQNWGAHIIPCQTLHREGFASVLDHIEPLADVVISLDLDVLDSTAMPAVAVPSPGGLSFVQLTDLIAGVAAKARIAGFAMVEFVPKRDLNGTAAYTAGRIAAHVIAHIARQTKHDKP